MPTKRPLPRAPSNEPACINGSTWNKLAGMAEKIDTIQGVYPISVTNNDAGVNISIANQGALFFNLTGTLPGGGIYSATPIITNVQLGTAATAGLTTSMIGVTTGPTAILVNLDEIGMGTCHFVPTGGSNWNPMVGYPCNGTGLVGGTSGGVYLFSWQVKGMSFVVPVAQTGGTNGSVSGSVVSLNTFTYTVLDPNSGTLLTTASPSIGHQDYGAVVTATLGQVYVNASGTAILQNVFEANLGTIC